MQENIGTLKVTVEDFDVVEGLEPANDLDEYAPDFVLTDVALLLLVHSDLLEQISVVRVLHDDAA